MAQGNKACSMSRGVANGFIITGMVFGLIGLGCVAVGMNTSCQNYNDPVCGGNLTIAGSVIMIIGFFIALVGDLSYRKLRRNAIRVPVTTTSTTQVVGGYPQANPNATGSYPSAFPVTTTGYPGAMPGTTTGYSGAMSGTTTGYPAAMPGTTTGYPGAMPSTTTGYPGAMPGTTTGYPAAMPGIATAYPTTEYQPSMNDPPPPPYSADSEQPGQVAAVPYPQSGTQGFPNEQNIAKVHGCPQP